jgi:uncharacterized membrane protein YebE (DUF533 family)
MSTDRILSRLLSNGAALGFAGGLAGGLAYSAWSRYRESPRLDGAPPAGSAPPPAGLGHFVRGAGRSEASEWLGSIPLRARAAAAQADGRLEGRERYAIYERVGALDLSEAEKASLLAQLDHPIDMADLVSDATTPEIAAEIYTASLPAIDVDSAAERGHLAMLAERPGLPDGLVDSIHQEIGVADQRQAPPIAIERGAS